MKNVTLLTKRNVNNLLSKKIIVLLGMMIFSLANVLANEMDVILTNNRQRIECYILQETDEVVFYMLPNSNDTRKYQMAKSEILHIYRVEHPTQATAVAEPVATKPIVTTPIESAKPDKVSKPKIYRDGDEYMYNNTYISSKEVAKILNRDDKVAYKQWKQADDLLISGSVFTGVGLGCVVGGLFGLIGGGSSFTIGCCSAGCVASIVGIGCILGSSSKYSKAVDLYNKNAEYAGTIQFQANSMGIGLTYNF